MSPEIETATAGDIAAICRLNLSVQRLHARLAPNVFKVPSSADDYLPFWSETLTADKNTVAVAKIAGMVAGYIWLELQERPDTLFTLARRRLYVHHIGVDPAWRGQGIGARLLAFAESTGRANAIQTVVLDAWAGNAVAQAFFSASGYEVRNTILVRNLVPD